MVKKVLIIGENAYLAGGFDINSQDYKVDKIKRPFPAEKEEKYNEYDYIVNFCIQPEHFSRLLSEYEMIDIQIAKKITNKNTKFIFLSSRKVYGSSIVLKKYNEEDKLKPFDFYSKNKVNIEIKLKAVLGENLLILRTSNIVGMPPKKNSPTFISWLESELMRNKKVTVTSDKNAVKDFITKEYFQYVLQEAIKLDISGVYNVGAGFGITIEELMNNIVMKNRLEYNQLEEKGEQFILNTDKLNQKIKKIEKKELICACKVIRKNLEKNLE